MREEVELLARRVASYMSPQPGLILLGEPLLSQTIQKYADHYGIYLTQHKKDMVKAIIARAWRTHAINAQLRSKAM